MWCCSLCGRQRKSSHLFTHRTGRRLVSPPGRSLWVQPKLDTVIISFYPSCYCNAQNLFMGPLPAANSNSPHQSSSFTVGRAVVSTTLSSVVPARRLKAANSALILACARPYRSRWTLSRHQSCLSGDGDDRPSHSSELGTDSRRGLPLHRSGMAQAAGRAHFRAVPPIMSRRVIPHKQGPSLRVLYERTKSRT